MTRSLLAPWLIAAGGGALAALLAYDPRDGRFRGLALLRFLGLTLLLALVVDAPFRAPRAQRPWLALDASASWLRGGDSAAWRRSVLRAASMRADSAFLFGDSLRLMGSTNVPGDLASRVSPAVERAVAAGRPLTVLTDGELEDPEALALLPAGSTVELPTRPPAVDAAVATLTVPRAAVAGDTVEAQVIVRAGNAAVPAGSLVIGVEGAPGATLPVSSLEPFGERTLSARLRLPRSGDVIVRAVVSVPGDAEPRNDTLATTIEIGESVAAVFVSSAPDFDGREALAVLRGAVSLPARAFIRVAPDAWRVEGTLAPVAERVVREAVRDAPVVVLHGDTAIFGPPRAATKGALALLPAISDSGGEWYATATALSPIAPSLAGVVWDSLPPLRVGAPVSGGEWVAVVARRSRRLDDRAVVAGTEKGRRLVVVGAAGWWRWRFRGGPSSEAYVAVMGSLFDWLAAERPARRSIAFADPIVRAGEPIRWRRGASRDSTFLAHLTRVGGPPWKDSVTLRFGPSASVALSAPLPSGRYAVAVGGQRSTLVVSASRELLPARPTARAGRVAGTATADSARGARAFPWLFLLVIGLLCAEWVVRRRRGLG